MQLVLTPVGIGGTRTGAKSHAGRCTSPTPKNPRLGRPWNLLEVPVVLKSWEASPCCYTALSPLSLCTGPPHHIPRYPSVLNVTASKRPPSLCCCIPVSCCPSWLLCNERAKCSKPYLEATMQPTKEPSNSANCMCKISAKYLQALAIKSL